MSNRLALESSLYLRQHAENPVDWYAWGEEALELARREDRPILLSIGYSSCHWCHVMERESFEDPEIARVMNEGFVNVKVDREERPDVDAIYMRAVQALTGHGGWPLTIFLTPDGDPFYGGTYFPPEPRQGMPSFRQLLEATRAAWDTRRTDVLDAASQIRDILKRSVTEPSAPGGESSPMMDSAMLGRATDALLHRVDPEYGGFGRAPKFPQPVALDFLLEWHAFTGHQPSLDAALHTLRMMARGGVRDHLGGGFHRYSVDARWLVPHFEKMLYDNALLAGTYLKAFQLSGEDEMSQVCREVLDDLMGDFRSPHGGFYTARDADSEGEEGIFYLWTPTQVAEHLPEDDARLFMRCYDVSDKGNFEGRNILHLPRELGALALDEGMSRDELSARLAASRRVLQGARAQREAPARDEKILTGWNALAIRTFAEAGAALNEPRYLEVARSGAEWLLEAGRPAGRLLHLVPEGERRIPAFLDDVAAMGNALLTLHEATLSPAWLEEAIAFDREVEERFRDPETGLLYDTPSDGERLVIRPREVTDSPTPSGTSLAAELRLRLARLLGDDRRERQASEMAARESGGMEQMPSGFGRLLGVAARLCHPPVEVAVMGPPTDSATRALLREVHRPFLPGRVVTGATDGRHPPVATPLLEARTQVGGRPTAYVCSRYTCRAPVTEPAALAAALSDMRTPPPGDPSESAS